MSAETTVGKIMLRRAIPEGLDVEGRDWTKNGVRDLLTELAERDPDRYPDVIQGLLTVGRLVSHTNGGSLSLKGIRSSPAKKVIGLKLHSDVDAVNNSPLSQQDKNARIIELIQEAAPRMQKAVYEDTIADEGNLLGQQVISGSKGSKANLMSLRGADLSYEDHEGNPIPVPVLNSYSEGLDPVEYWAGSYGARKGLVDLKFAVADAGYYGKRLANAAHRLVVTDEAPLASRLPVGLPVTPSDPDSVGSVLAADVAGYKSGTVITSAIRKDLERKLGERRFLIHSPITSLTAGGGIDRLSAGVREKSMLAPIGDNIGIAAAQSVSERVSQGLISCIARGTLVRMADLSEKKIEDIVVGDRVLGADLKGRVRTVAVTRVYDQGTQPVYRTEFRRGKRCRREVLTTLEHKFLVAARSTGPGEDVPGIIPVGKVNRDTRAVGVTRVPNRRWRAGYYLRAKQVYVGELPTYDIEVDHPDHLFVLANGLIVSNSKHAGGVGAGPKNEFAGFKYLDALAEAPASMSQAGMLAPIDGHVTSIEPADQGGNYIVIGDQRIYVPQHRTVTAKPGQAVEAGDLLTDGIPHPADLVRHKGIGEARRVMSGVLVEAFRNSGAKAHRRNAETIATGLINHVRVTNPNGLGDYLPDDVVPYARMFGKGYTPRPTSQVVSHKMAYGRYLEEPVLHYTPGTRVTKSVQKDLDEFSVPDITVSDEQPDFEPQFVRSVMNLYHDPDWMTQLGGFYTGKAFQGAVQRGAKSELKSTSFYPGLAASDSFGQSLSTDGKY